MKIEIAYRDDEARRVEYFLRRKYKSRAGLKRLIKLAVAEAAAEQAQAYLNEITK